MKISYKVLWDYIKNLKSPEEVAQDLILHTAEVEEIVYEWENLKDVFIWEVLEYDRHPDSEKLNICKVRVKWEEIQIVCWAPNVRAWIKVPVAVVWAKLAPDFVIAKTKIRWETSCWMICSEDELGLIKERQAGILILPDDAPLDLCVRDYFNKDDAVLEVDNKAINHRPDLFSHIWIIREIYALAWEKFDFNYENRDFSSLPDLWIKNEITDVVRRYKWVKVWWVKNIETPDYIKRVLSSADCDSKWLLVDLSNYSLYLYGQPTHMFDADKVKWNIVVRYAKAWEKFLALDDKEYELNTEDIVIADDAWVIALGWIIGWKNSAISDTTTNVIIEWAHFHQAVLRKSWKRLWLRTDALNVFEKDLLPEMAQTWVSLIVSELEKNLWDIKLEAQSDVYENEQEIVKFPFDIEFVNKIIWRKYDEKYAFEILNNLWTKVIWLEATIPFWRKDLNFKADLAEEIARVDGYDKVEATIPRVNLWAVMQSNMYNMKNDVRSYLTSLWFFDLYNYSFVNEELMQKMWWDLTGLVAMKNALSDELTHMKWSLLPNLMLSLEKNIRTRKDLKLFEIEKVFKLEEGNSIKEDYFMSWVMTSEKDMVYYDIQKIVSQVLKNLWVAKFNYDTLKDKLCFAHNWRTSEVIVRWNSIWYVWEIHPKIVKNFDVNSRVWFFELDITKLENALYSIVKAEDVSEFQENNFDISFVVDKVVKWKDIKTAIEKTDINLIKKVELFDIYEDGDKLPGKRSISFKVFIQSLDWTLDDKVKNELIWNIVKKVEKKGGVLR